MKKMFVRAAAVAAAAAGTLIASSALADNVVMTQPQQQQPAQQTTTQPASGPTVVNNTTTPAQPQPAPVVGTTTTTAAPAPVVVNSEQSPTRAEHADTEYEGPNTALLWSGAVMLGLSYGSAAVVGSVSTLDQDRNLLIPVAGPWVDLATRPGCGSGPTDRSCSGETASKAGIAIDGVFQGLGTLQIIGAFVWPRHHSHDTIVNSAKADSKKIYKPTIHFAPTKVGYDGYGLGAGGTF